MTSKPKSSSVKKMTVRQRMLALLNNEPIDEAVVSPLFESDYACYIKGSKRPSDVNCFEDYLRTAEAIGGEPTFEAIIDWGKYDPELAPKINVLHKDEDTLRREMIWHSPKGDLRMVTEEHVGLTPFLIEGGITSTQQFGFLEWYFEKMGRCAAGARESVRETMKKIGDRGIARAQVGNTFELSFIKYPDILYLYMDDPGAYNHIVEVFWEAQKPLIKACIEGGADLIYASGVAAEMMSPQMFEATFLPLLKRKREFVHENGGKFYYHSCGRTKNFIEMGFYNEILPDVFETLSPPPYGIVDDLRYVREILDPRICTKGNLDTELLRSGPIEKIEAAAEKIVEATKGYRHIVALADSVLYGTPPEHVHAMVKAAKERYRSLNG